MRFRDALKWSLKYHSLAIVPTLLGVAVVAAAVYVGAIRPVLPALQGAAPSLESLSTVVGAVNAPLVAVGVLGGVYVRRVGRTALLVRTQGQAVDAKLAAKGLVDPGTESAGAETATEPMEAGTAADDPSRSTVDDGPQDAGTYDDSFAGSDDGAGDAGTYDDSFVGSDDATAGDDASEEFAFETGTDERE